ncbi:TAXI family TRAP transporter solute-binding subunit [Halomonas sp. NO4]|uniref:TAXI family TRAP transporter solute-binding subunit n=1 Tax=Halomonas sp. NO4 TaxID=2484813 RepID=UPI0013D72263|nr:TAXI family TRAP transporter solute-binding subunit [Halomonas sp. NO4]
MNRLTALLLAWLGGLVFSASLVANAQETLRIGTASPDGVYHVAGRALCQVVTLPCRAEPGPGSSANLEAIRDGRFSVALAQSDLQFQAVNGTATFSEAGPDPDLRSLFSLHSEPFTLVVRRRSGIRSLEDLPGRAVNIGNPGSGQRGTMFSLMDAQGWQGGDFRLLNDLPADQQAMALCHGDVDAMVYTVGHPNRSIAQAIRLCNAALLDVDDEAVERLIAERPYFSRASIPGGLYSADQPAVRTFGVRATLVAHRDADPELIYRLVADVFDNLLRFKAFHPAFGTLTPASMVQAGLTAPLHEGALRYYRERGWVSNDSVTATSQ